MEINKKICEKNNTWLYANYSILIPGLGQSVAGNVLRGIIFCVIILTLILMLGLSMIIEHINSGISIVLLLLTFAVYIWNIVDSLKDRRADLSNPQRRNEKEKNPWIAVFLNQIVIGLGFFYIKKWYFGILTIFLFILLKYLIKNMLLYFLIRSIFIATVCFIVYRLALNKNLKTKKHIFIISTIVLVVNMFNFLAATYITDNWFSPCILRSSSMEPVISRNSYNLISKYNKNKLERGDIVLYKINLRDKEKNIIHRVIAFEGETVEITNGCIYVNNQIIFENMKILDKGKFGVKGNIFTVPSNSIFVLGDNSEKSIDSRFFGAIPIDAIIGKYKKTVFKLSN